MLDINLFGSRTYADDETLLMKEKNRGVYRT